MQPKPASARRRDDSDRMRGESRSNLETTRAVSEERAGQIAEMVRLQLRNGNFDACRSAIATAEAEIENPKDALSLDAPLAQLPGLCNRTVGVLERVHILTVGQLAGRSRDELLAIANINDATIGEIVKALADADVRRCLR